MAHQTYGRQWHRYSGLVPSFCGSMLTTTIYGTIRQHRNQGEPDAGDECRLRFAASASLSVMPFGRLAMAMNWRFRFTRRQVMVLFALGVLYGMLWWITGVTGVSRTRAAALRAMGEIPPSWTDVSYAAAPPTNGPTYFCRASAYAPFLVRVDYGWVSDPLRGDGGSAWYLWVCGAVFRAYEFCHCMV